MISVHEAKNIIARQVATLPARPLQLKDANGRTLAADIYGQTDIPGFVQSSVDGYAFAFGGQAVPMTVALESAAGILQEQEIKPGEAARIFTGAPLPAGADTVAMQEYCSIENGKVTIHDTAIKPGDNVRARGAELRAGELAMQRGERITPAGIGFLAGIGVHTIMVHPAPAVTLIITGKELCPAGSNLKYGHVYDANSVMLTAALQAAQVYDISVVFADDELQDVQQELAEALAKSDIVLLSGGISVGNYDFVLQATKNSGVQQHFHKVKQKPGKPLYFGTKDGKLIFGLPGNPSSALTCFYEYVLPAIDVQLHRKMSIPTEMAILQQDFLKKAGLTHFLKGYVDDGKVQLLKAQESFRLASYATANCLVVFGEEGESFAAGSMIEIHRLTT